MVRQIYWQVADARRRASDRLISSRSTQVGKEDFLIVVIVPICARLGVMEVEKMVMITYLTLSMGDRCIK